MQLFGRDLEHEVVVVAEVGVNHEGDLATARHLLRLAAETGADAVKFQSYSPDRYASKTDAGRFERVSGFALAEAAFQTLVDDADSAGIAVFSTPLSEDWVPLLAEVCPAIKIASGDLTFEPVLRAAARSERPIILSTGLGLVDEIDQAVGWVREEVGDALKERLVLLHCIAAYPTPLDQVNVRSVPFLRDRYGLTIGYSHHALEVEPCLAAVALGARVVEAHFTDRRHDREFRDHSLSLEPTEMSQLVQSVRAVSTSLGNFGKNRARAELPGLEAMRKGIIAARDLATGTVIHADDLMFARPATEFAAGEWRDLVGRPLTVDLKRGELIPRAGIGN